MRHRWRPCSRSSLGQGLVEFALVLPLFLLMFFGIVDGARYVYMSSVLSQAAREGARLASVEASWIGSGDASCNQTGGPVCRGAVTGANSFQTDIATAVNRMTVPFGTVPNSKIFFQCNSPGNAPTGNWTGTTCGTNASTNITSVRVELTFVPITPVIGQIMGSITMSGSATMVIN
ncbi:MAG TPA: TadE/TadG family type IV pilus assembly protein [Candidatus Dormibacteraeota bacterium]|nr:TadE/TadG family type IV pilus assembly protein [Candidatus Dormibacteraeota bacterium]